MTANKNITGDNIKLIRPAYRMYFDNCCDNSVRFVVRLYCSFKCQLSNTDHGLPVTKCSSTITSMSLFTFFELTRYPKITYERISAPNWNGDLYWKNSFHRPLADWRLIEWDFYLSLQPCNSWICNSWEKWLRISNERLLSNGVESGGGWEWFTVEYDDRYPIRWAAPYECTSAVQLEPLESDVALHATYNYLIHSAEREPKEKKEGKKWYLLVVDGLMITYIIYFQCIIEKFLNVIKLHGMIKESNQSKYPK